MASKTAPADDLDMLLDADDSDGAVVTTAPEPQPNTMPDFQAMMQAAISEALAVVKAEHEQEKQALYLEIAKAQAAVPQYRPMLTPDDPAVVRRQLFDKNMRKQGATAGARQIPVDSAGQPTNKKPKFPSGTQVRIRRDVAREGFPPGKTWGDVLDALGAPGIGEIRTPMCLTKTGQWKYKVTFPGVMRVDQIDGFYDYEMDFL